ncbi:MAG: DUF515 domain-containing protein [Euryarchaeota archaeon]|nr:DUF515 domain-containing protein [Euryarchaeota archaeon]
MSRLEALRKRAPPKAEAAPAAPAPPSDDRRRRLYRIVGVAVIILIIFGIFLAGYKFLIKPMEEKAKIEEQQAAKAREAFAKAQQQKIAEIEQAFAGLPPKYAAKKDELITRVRGAKSASDLAAVDVAGAASAAWREYLLAEAAAKKEVFGEDRIMLVAGNATYKGYERVVAAISGLSYSVLKTATIEQIRTVFVPVRLPRAQAAGGFMMPGDYVNIYYKNNSQAVEIVTDARVVAILRATASISLSESENRIVSGQGGEAKGEGSITTSGVSSLKGPISIGIRQSSSSTTYTVNLKEVQKAAAANKIDPSYIEAALRNYGIKLSQLEIESQLGDFDEEYLILLEMREEEAKALISKYLSDKEKANLQMVLSQPSSWMQGR